MLLSDSGGGGYGFSVPQGDPGALRAAAGQWQALGAALSSARSAVTAASERALSAGGWTGSAAQAFTTRAEDLVKVMSRAVEASATARGALEALAAELEHAQSVTSAALGACAQAEQTYTAQTLAADQAGQEATAKAQQAQTTVHPATATDLSNQAASARHAQQVAGNAAGRAQDDLAAAQTRGQDAVTAYDTAAVQIVARLQAAATELTPAADGGTWQEAVLQWVGHALDFSGAGTVAIGKGYEAVFAQGVRQMNREVGQYLSSDAVLSETTDGPLPAFQSNETSLWSEVQKATEDHQSWEDSPVTKILTKGWLSEDAHSILGRVPIISTAFTGLDIAHNLAGGENPVQAVGVPVANLAVGTAVAEGTSSAVAAGATALAGGGELMIAGSTLIPGVGEVVIAGAVTVGVTIAVDKGATWVWDHGGSEVAHAAWNDVSHAVTHPMSTIKSIAHDLDPLNW